MIYLDNAATTKPDAYGLEYYITQYYANPSALYESASEVNSKVEEIRQGLADSIGCSPNEIYFTSGGSESDNWALKGIAFKHRHKGKHIITSQIEHHAVLNTCKFLEECGFTVTYLPVDDKGFVSLDELKNTLEEHEDTILVSIMFANNEIGTIQPISKIAEICHQHNVLFHTDAVQAIGHIPINVRELGVDLLSASGHKFGGIKGTGFLYKANDVEIEPLIHGGGQEQGLRAGTLNTPGIFSMRIGNIDNDFVVRKTDYLAVKLENAIPNITINGSWDLRLPNNINISIPGIEGESLLIMLDQYGIAASSGSACSTGSLDPSHVLKAIGLSDEQANSSIRLTLSDEISYEELDFVTERIASCVEILRGVNPNYGE